MIEEWPRTFWDEQEALEFEERLKSLVSDRTDGGEDTMVINRSEVEEIGEGLEIWPRQACAQFFALRGFVWDVAALSYSLMRLTKPRRKLAQKQYGSAEVRSRHEALNASEELFSQSYDDASWSPHVAQPVEVLILGHFAHELGAEVGAHASHSLIDALDCKHHAP